MTRIHSLALFAFGLLLGAHLAAAPAPDETVLTILHTNDMHGHVLSSGDGADGPGGLARIVTMARRIRAEMPNTLFLDAGDIVHSTPTEFYTQGEAMMRAMDAAGYDAATLGNHEFDWGQLATAANINRANFPFLSANVVDARTGEPFAGVRPYKIFQAGPVRVAVFGLTTLETVEIEWPPAISRVKFTDPVEAARRLVPELRKQADVVIALSHLGVKDDRALAESVPGIDAIIGGHSHTTLASYIEVGDTLIAQTGSYAKNLGRMDLLLKREGDAWKVVSANGRDGRWWADMAQPPLGKTYPKMVLLPADEVVPQDAAVKDAYMPFFESAQKRLSERLTEAPEPIEGSGKTEIRPLPALFAEMLRRSVSADVAIVQGDAGPRIPAGPVTLRSVYDNIGGYTRQNVVMVRATGAALRAAIVHSYRKPGEYPVYYAGVSGRVERSGSVARLLDAKIGGQPLENGKTYTVAAPSYLIMDHPTLYKSEVVSDRLGWEKPLIADAMRGLPSLAALSPALILPPPPAPEKTGEQP